MPQAGVVTLIGNLGADPETRLIPARERTVTRRDPIIDDMVERTFMTREREVRTFSIAIHSPRSDGSRTTRWVRCDDWHERSRLVRKGFRVEITGYFRTRTCEWNGATRTFQNFIVQDLQILRRPAPPEVP